MPVSMPTLDMQPSRCLRINREILTLSGSASGHVCALLHIQGKEGILYTCRRRLGAFVNFHT